MNAFESRGSRLVLSLFGLIFAGALLFHPLLGVAQTTGTAQGLTISPFLLERQLNKGETLNDTIEVSNTTGRTLPISIVVEDFQPVEITGRSNFCRLVRAILGTVFRVGLRFKTVPSWSWVRMNAPM